MSGGGFQRFDLLWPIMQGCGIKVGAVWPNESFDFRIESHQVE